MEKSLKAPAFFGFILSPAGRGMQVVIGVLMIFYGFVSFSVLGSVIAALGIFPLMAGIMDICLLGPLFGGFYRGDKMRAVLHLQQGHPEFGTNPQSWVKA